jgi:hypothetical protein
MVVLLSFLACKTRDAENRTIIPEGTYKIVIDTDTASLEGKVELKQDIDSAWVGVINLEGIDYSFGPVSDFQISDDSLSLGRYRFRLKVDITTLLGYLTYDDTTRYSATMTFQYDRVSQALKQSLGYVPITIDDDFLAGRWPTPISDSAFYYVASMDRKTQKSRIRLVEKSADGWTETDVAYDNDFLAVYSIGISSDKSYFIAHALTRLEEDDPDYRVGLFKMTLTNPSTVDSIIYLPETVNDNGLVIFPSVHQDESIYFAANGGEQNLGKMDIYKAVPDGEDYEVSNLDAPVNSELSDAAPWVSPDKTKMLFYRRTAPGQYPSTDKIFLAKADENGWSDPVKLGPPVNTPYAFEYGARLSPSGNFMFLTSARRGEGYIYQIPVEEIPEL